jgi:hypothetical protein
MILCDTNMMGQRGQADKREYRTSNIFDLSPNFNSMFDRKTSKQAFSTVQLKKRTRIFADQAGFRG